MKRYALAGLLLATPAVPVAGQAGAALGQRLDSIAGYWVQRHAAIGLVAAVVRGNDTLLTRSYGKADIEWDVRMPLAAIFEIGSVTKQPGRDTDMVVEVTQTPQGPAFTIDGAPPRAIPWIEDLTFGRGLPRLIFRRVNGDSGPVTELRFSMPGAHFVLEKQ